MSEWLRRWTRNPLGSARRGSNPLGVVCFFHGILDFAPEADGILVAFLPTRNAEVIAMRMLCFICRGSIFFLGSVKVPKLLVTVWPSGLRRQTQVLVEQSSWVRTPQLSYFFLILRCTFSVVEVELELSNLLLVAYLVPFVAPSNHM